MHWYGSVGDACLTLLRKSDVRPAFFDGNVFITPPQQGELVLLGERGSWGGSVYEYRGAEIHANASSTRYWFFLPGFPGGESGAWHEAVQLPRIIAALDAWLDVGDAAWTGLVQKELQY